MTYQAKVDVLQKYTFFQKGHTYQMFMCNYPVSKRNLSKRMLPLHSRVLALFDTIEETNHQRAIDNIYNSAIFFKAAYNNEKH